MMPSLRKTNRSKTPAKKVVPDSQPGPRVSTCRGLVWVDTTERRALEHKNYRLQAKELSRLTQVLTRHEEHDAGAFRRWVQITFSNHFDELSTIDREEKRLEELLAALRRYQDVKGETRYKTYLLVSEAQVQGVLDDFMALHCPLKPPFDGEHDTQGPEGFGDFFKDQDGNPYDSEDAKREFWQEDSFSCHGHRGESEGTRDQGFGRSSPTKPVDADPYLKDLYRQLVRALHPDLGHEITDDQLRQWAAVQDAYRHGDVERMAALYQQIVNKDHGFRSKGQDIETMSLGELISMRRKLQQKVRLVRRRLIQAREDLHWDFQRNQSKSKTSIHGLRSQLEAEFRWEILRKQDALKALKRRLRRWSTDPQRAASKSR